MNRLREEMKVIPRLAWVFAVVLGLGIPACFLLFWSGFFTGDEAPSMPPLPLVGISVAMSISLFVFTLLIGYIAGDARRRGMSVVLWVLLAIFIPNAIGVILYFILRNPLLQTCPKCGVRSNPAFPFCPACGAALSQTCPACRSAVESAWSHCARCGVQLRTA
jgi:hypothetical protein